jgi:hypothetical protein
MNAKLMRKSKAKYFGRHGEPEISNKTNKYSNSYSCPWYEGVWEVKI